MADHGDHLTNRFGLSIDAPHNELTDLFVFRKKGRINLISAFDPTFPKGENEITWPLNLTWRANIDLSSPVDFDHDPDLNAVAGGYIPEPENIRKDIVLEISFKPNNQPRLRILGNLEKQHRQALREDIKIFTGVRAEPFPFAPLVRRNRPTIALSLDRDLLFDGDPDPTLLAWAQSVIEADQPYTDSTGQTMVAGDGPYIDTAGRALRSQFPVDQRVINSLDPSEQVANGFAYPDVVIYDTSKPASIPNGRSLDDDVLTYLSGLSGTMPGTTPGPGENANTGVAFALEAEKTFPDGGGIPYVDPGATRSDIRTWDSFPYLGLPYNISADSTDNKEPVARFFDKTTGSYYYTSNANDISRWQSRKKTVDQGVVFESMRVGRGVHRFFDPQQKTYFWTASQEEYMTLRHDDQYRYQGETFFVQPPGSPTPGATAIHRLYNEITDRYFWSGDSGEINRFIANGYADQGLAWTSG